MAKGPTQAHDMGADNVSGKAHVADMIMSIPLVTGHMENTSHAIYTCMPVVFTSLFLFFFFFVPFFPMSQYKIRQGCEDNVLMLGRAVTQCPRQGCEVNVLM